MDIDVMQRFYKRDFVREVGSWAPHQAAVEAFCQETRLYLTPGSVKKVPWAFVPEGSVHMCWAACS